MAQFIVELLALLCRPCLKNVKTPKLRVFIRHAALKILEIHQVFLRIFALPGEEIPRRWAFRHFTNKAYLAGTGLCRKFLGLIVFFYEIGYTLDEKKQAIQMWTLIERAYLEQ